MRLLFETERTERSEVEKSGRILIPPVLFFVIN